MVEPATKGHERELCPRVRSSGLIGLIPLPVDARSYRKLAALNVPAAVPERIEKMMAVLEGGN